MTTSPVVQGPRDVPELRLWLDEQWKPGRAYAAAAHQLMLGGPGVPASGVAAARQAENCAAWERRSLANGTLWWAAPEMVDLLNAAFASIPDDVTPADLPVPSPCGLIVFGAPLVGHDARSGGELLVDGLVWNVATSLPPIPGYSDRPRVGLSISSYRCLDYSAGLGGNELHLALATGAIDNARPDGVTVSGGSVSYSLHGQTWAPLGRSDWPIHEPLDRKPWPLTDAQWASMLEDRRFVAALFTLLAQEGLASRTLKRPERPVVRRTQRAGIDRALADVRVVRLRRPHVEGDPEAEPSGREWSHRWVVDGHWRWQACGPGRAERRLTYIAPYVKGPADKPLKTPTRVNAWVR